MDTPYTKPILWLTDLHLDRAEAHRRHALYESIGSSKAGIILITGDISTAKMLPVHLQEIASAATPRRVLFCLGNHDFYGSSFAAVESMVAGVCKAHANLQQLGQGEIFRINSSTALVGHRGWGDGRMGWSEKSFARNPDFQAIEDFKGLNKRGRFELLRHLGLQSASYLRGVLPYALRCYQNLIVATHVPPFSNGACYHDRPCDRLRQPFYVNISMGGFLLRLARAFPKNRITVLAGHTHCGAYFKALPGLELRVGAASPGVPRAQGLFEVSSDGLSPVKYLSA